MLLIRLTGAIEEHVFIGPADGARPREVLINIFDEISGDMTNEQ